MGGAIVGPRGDCVVHAVIAAALAGLHYGSVADDAHGRFPDQAADRGCAADSSHRSDALSLGWENPADVEEKCPPALRLIPRRGAPRSAKVMGIPSTCPTHLPQVARKTSGNVIGKPAGESTRGALGLHR